MYEVIVTQQASTNGDDNDDTFLLKGRFERYIGRYAPTGKQKEGRQDRLQTLALPIETTHSPAPDKQNGLRGTAASQTTLHEQALGMLFDWRAVWLGHTAS